MVAARANWKGYIKFGEVACAVALYTAASSSERIAFNTLTRGGHLLDGIVRPTLEVMVRETPAHLHRRKRPELGIALIDL